MRASESSSSSLSRSRQLKTLLEKPCMVHLLKTTRPKLPPRRTKSKHYFSPYVRPNCLGKPHPGTVSYTYPIIQISFLLEQSQPSQIFILPSGVREHGAERADRKCIAQAVVSRDDTAAVAVAEDAMTSTHALQNKTIGFQRSDELTGRQAARRTRQTLTTTAGSGNSIVPWFTGICSPASMRS